MIIKVPVDNLQGIALLRPLKGPSKMNKLFIQTTIEQNALRMSGSSTTEAQAATGAAQQKRLRLPP